MKSSRRIVEAIFFGAASLANGGERKTFLDSACGGDTQLRLEVEAMLAAQGDAERFFSQTDTDAEWAPGIDGKTAADPAQDTSSVPEFDERVGEWIGRYKLVEKLGEGGWGAVYLAEQQEPVIRRVALKVIRLGMDTRTVIARFEAERQALALMNHPNIARVLDVGATSRGRPYFVMELVSGTPIAEFCNAHQLELRQRLDLFVQVCHAVQHAHQKGIIHRDLKPSNILVANQDGVPAPKVIDFGIAKAIEGEASAVSIATAAEHIAGTPAYMSPEQMVPGAADVDTRSDIYSLGVVLYELLTGRTPFDGAYLMRTGLDAMRQTILQMEPPLPSSVATGGIMDSAKLARELRSDLDWIILKALAKDRTRRYETANGLAADVLRYLNDEPVAARPLSRVYRFHKSFRRNKAVFLASGAVTLALIAGLSVSIVMYFKARQAELQQARLRQVAEEARANETALRVQAEARETLTEAVILVNQGQHEEAARRLEQMKVLPTQPSLDGVAALRAVGNWLASQSRWKESGGRFLTLLNIDELDDWGAITWDYQCCGAALAEAGEREPYDRFCETALKNFSTTTNGIAAGRMLDACLMLPPSPQFLSACTPLGKRFEEWTTSPKPEDASGWPAIPISLWNYRHDRFDAALSLAQDGLAFPKKCVAHGVALQAIAAMSLEKTGHHAEAVAMLAPARRSVDTSFQRGLEHGNHNLGFWHDWVFSRILVREASQLIASSDAP